MAVLYGSVLFADTLESFVFAVRSVKEVQILSWEEIIIDLIRGSVFLELDTTSSIPDSHFTAFTYLRLPRVVQHLCSNEVPTEVLFSALFKVAGFHTLFNNADLKSRCDTFHFLLQEFSKLGLISDSDVNVLMEERNKEKYNLVETPPDNQPNVTLVLKAEPTLQTLLKSFNSDIIQKQEKLAQMMHHMISGKSFEFICAAAAATGKIKIFAAKLMEFNESSKLTDGSEEPGKDLALGGELFDLSFLLLSRIAQLYSAQILYPLPTSQSFFESWCNRYCVLSTPPSDNVVYMPGQADQNEDFRETFKNWNDICEQIPLIGQAILNELKKDSLTGEEMTNVFMGLLWVKVNGVQWICCLLLCLAQWIVHCKPSEERKKQVFMASVTKRMLSPLLAPPKIPQSLHPWLYSTKKLSAAQIADEDPQLLPNADVLHILLAKCLQQSWVLSSVFVMVEKFTRLGKIRKFIKALIEELQKLFAQEEIIIWCDLTLACCLVSPSRCLYACVDAIVNFVLEPGRDLFCVAPRGPVLAHFLVQLYLISLKFCSSQLSDIPSDLVEGFSDSQLCEPVSKMPKLDAELGKLNRVYYLYPLCATFVVMAVFLTWQKEDRSLILF
ncbi:unnamed protein product [Soboliphyme baturini]|uniref:Mediator of RNA polymerase II transcription subunit 24 n=1 Tax=Soboliphyme baturini TaxID=241478 RepID=A0A183IVZ1_9BILA|nr:unnamed protein product [Soboliphyme baturini]